MTPSPDAGTRRNPLRIALVALGGILGLFVLLFAAAWFLMPRDFIQKQAIRVAERAGNAAVRWKRIEPGFQRGSLGVRVLDLEYRTPARGPARLQARLPEAFVRFELFPLLFRRVEVSGARIRGGGIVMTDRGPEPPGAAGAEGGSGFRIRLPRVDLDQVSIRTRDPLGAGFDAKRVRGFAEIDGTLERPRAIRLDAEAESLYWKPEARSALLPLPSPLGIEAELEPRERGSRLIVTKGRAMLGPLESAISGEVRLPPAPAPAQLALRATGGPQEIRSSDPALQAFSAKSPAAWSATVSWDLQFGGTQRDMTHQGRLLFKPISVSAPSNTFTMDQASVIWSGAADRSFVGRAEGFGGGVTFTAEARGAARSGSGATGTFYARLPAERLNGLAPNSPTWSSGTLECRGTFASRPPAEVSLAYTITGAGFSGTVPGLARPVRRLAFEAAGTSESVHLNSLEAVVGSTTAAATGDVKLGAVRTGTFDVRVDRLVAEEWSGARSPSAPASEGGAGAPAGDPLPLKSFIATTRIGELRMRRLVIRNVTVPVRYAAAKFVADPIEGSIGTGSVRGAFDLAGFGTKPEYTLHLDVKQVPVEDLASGLLPLRLPLSGTLTEIIDLRGAGLPGPESAGSMRGTASGTVERGYLRQSQALKSLRGALGASAPPEVPFESITHALRISGGKLLLDKVTGDLGKDLFSLSGALGFDQSLDLDALLRLAPERVQGGGFLASLARYAKDEEGRIPVQVKITGTALAPKVSVKPASLLEAAGKAYVEERIKGLLGRGRRDTAAATPLDSVGAAPRDTSRAAKPDSAANPVRKAIERLLGR